MSIKWLPQQGLFSIPLIREITLILVIKIIIIFTIRHYYFSDPVPFNADHLFGEVNGSKVSCMQSNQEKQQ